MNFEWDADKSKSNESKHGISFGEAKVLWLDQNAIELNAITEGEARVVRIGFIESKMWTAIFTMRGENIRIISVRRARKNEEKIYAQNQ